MHRLQQLYNSVLRQFDQASISNIVARIRASSQIASQALQPQAQLHQPTEVDYEALLVSISSESSAITPEAMSILPQCFGRGAHQLQQLYNSVLRQFDQASISSVVARIRASSQIAFAGSTTTGATTSTYGGGL